VVKPFSVAELMARVKAVLRRAVPRRTADVIEIADITLDRAAHRVTRAGREVKLGPIEYKLLLVLMESAGRVLSRSQLLDLVWGRDGDIEERTIDVHVGRLRQTLVHASESDPIRTVRGAGYMFQSRDPTQSKAGRRGERRANVPQR
jgi:two-component system phosphate regulon response regulator PhoB